MMAAARVDVRRTPCAVAKEIAPTRTGDKDEEEKSPNSDLVKSLTLIDGNLTTPMKNGASALRRTSHETAR